MTVVSPTGILSIDMTQPDNSSVFRASNGAIIATFDPDADTARHYAVSTDNGATWSAAQPLIASPVGFDLYNLLGFLYGSYWVGDKLYIFADDNGDLGAGMTSVGTELYILTFSTASNTFTGVARYEFGGPTPARAAAYFDGTRFHVALGGASGFVLFTVGLDGTTSAAQNIYLYTGSTPSSLSLTVDHAGNAVVVFAYANQVAAISYTYTGGTYSAPTSAHAESVATVSVNDAVVGTSLDPLGNVDIVIQDGATITATKRTSVGVYQAMQPLYAGAAMGLHGSVTFALVPNATQDELYVFFEADGGNPSGEIFFAVRRGGIWQPVARVLGGPAQIPDANKTITGGIIDLIYQMGSTGIGYLAVAAASGPTKPTNLTPSGLVGTQTPLFGWQYNNSSPANPQSAFQLQVFLHGTTSSPVIDTGRVTSALSQYQAVTSLTYAQEYDFQVRTYDTTSNSGAGTVSPWSDIQSFTPARGATIVITAVTPQPGGTPLTSSPSTLDSPHEETTFTWTQADGHAAASFLQKLYAADGVTLIGQGGTGTGGGAASGSTIISFDTYWPSMQNGSTYVLVIEGTDATSGVVSRSAPFVLNTAWTPPPNVTSLAETQDIYLGTVTLTWINPTEAASNIVQRQLVGTALWETIYSGPAITTLTTRPALAQVYNYRVFAVSSAGVQSTGTSLLNIILDSPFAIIFTDTLDPSQTVGLRAPNDWDQTGLTLTQDLQSYVPLGRDKPIAFFGMAAFYQAQTVTYWVPAWDDLPGGIHLLGKDVTNNLDALIRRMNPIQYRDRRGKVFYCTLTNYLQFVDEDIHFKVEFDFSQISYDGPLL